MADRGFANNAGLNTGQGPVEISTSIAGTREIASTAGSQSSHPEVKLDAGSQLEIANSGRQNFRGHCSGFAFLTQMQQKYGDLLIPEAGPSTTVTIRFDLPQVFDSPLSLGKQGPIIPPPLPPKTVAVDLIECALENVCTLSWILHRPTFDTMFSRIYDLGAVKLGPEETRFLPLLYILMALGCFASTTQIEKIGQKRAMAAGIELFAAARQMTDITDCRDTTSLQTAVFIILFLQCSLQMSTSYTYVGIILKSAVHMGLHRRVVANFNPIERETRSRIFWVLRKMDIYVSAVLGLPGSIADNDIDQEMPLEVDDECILEDRILPQPYGRWARMAATNAHIRLMGILQKITTHVYPPNGGEHRIAGGNKAYLVDRSKVNEIEVALQRWLGELPKPPKESASFSERLARHAISLAASWSCTLMF
ncbi:hypothetical protein LTR04_001213 [Oleoguttula sp. CCFEE 6159]|nr:hypothetical protein LTR04_001213 [Oleoguttula sp. CCFEE 6159]